MRRRRTRQRRRKRWKRSLTITDDSKIHVVMIRELVAALLLILTKEGQGHKGVLLLPHATGEKIDERSDEIIYVFHQPLFTTRDKSAEKQTMLQQFMSFVSPFDCITRSKPNLRS